jgi:hypothetical protein
MATLGHFQDDAAPARPAADVQTSITFLITLPVSCLGVLQAAGAYRLLGFSLCIRVDGEFAKGSVEVRRGTR